MHSNNVNYSYHKSISSPTTNNDNNSTINRLQYLNNSLNQSDSTKLWCGFGENNHNTPLP